MRVEGQEASKRKIEDAAKAVDKVEKAQQKLNRTVGQSDRAMQRMWDKAATATSRATREVEKFNREMVKMSRNEKDMAFNERFGMGRAGKLANPFTGQGMGGAAGTAGGKVGKTMNTLEGIGNIAAVLSLFDTLTNKIGETVNSIKKWDGSLMGTMKILGDFSGIIFSTIGIVATVIQAFVALKTAALIAAAAQTAGGAGGAAGGFAAGAAGGAAATGARGLLAGGLAAAARVLWPVLVAAGLAWGANEFLDAQEKAEMNAASKSKDATGKGKALSGWREEYQKASAKEQKMLEAEAKNRATLEAKALRNQEKAMAKMEREAKAAAKAKAREEEKAARALEKAALAMERSAMNALSASEAFLRALLPNTFAQPLIAGAPQQTSGLGGWLNQKLGTQDMTTFQKNAQTDLEGLGEAFAKGVKKKARPATKYDATRLLDGALGAHH